MTDGPERAFLAIADISGYTSYLAGVELDHAQDILSDLTVTIVEAMAPFQLAKLEGDAAFMWLPAADADGSLLQDTVEGTYIAFKRRLRDIKQTSTCDCNACILIPDLDLKTVVHEGVIGRQHLMGLEELVGPEVILVHRLLKNRVREDAGLDAYALYTQSAVDAANIDPGRQGLIEHTEETDVAGRLTCWLRDLAAVWTAAETQPRQTIPPERVAFTRIFEIDAPPELVFEEMTSPTSRADWDASIDVIDEDSEANGGRRGVGSTNHCMHGKDAIVERILDWRPPEFWLTETTLPIKGSPRFVKAETYTRRPDGGTQLEMVVGSIEGRLPADDEPIFESFVSNIEGLTSVILQRIEDTVSSRAARGADMPELPTPGDSHLTQPVSR